MLSSNNAFLVTCVLPYTTGRRLSQCCNPEPGRGHRGGCHLTTRWESPAMTLRQPDCAISSHVSNVKRNVVYDKSKWYPNQGKQKEGWVFSRCWAKGEGGWTAAAAGPPFPALPRQPPCPPDPVQGREDVPTCRAGAGLRGKTKEKPSFHETPQPTYSRL